MIMEILTFFVVYYHVFFISSAVVIGLDYILETDVFASVREAMDTPYCSFLIFVECCMAVTGVVGYFMNSVPIMSTLWTITLVLIGTVLFSIIVYAVHKLLDMEW